MPDLSALTGMQPLSLWILAGLLVLFFLISVAAVRRSGSPGSVAALVGVPALVVVAWSAWSFTERAEERQWQAERRALDARALHLTGLILAPGSSLACLEAGARDALQEACEAALFQRPETVAAATAFVETKIRLLTDSVEHARRAGRSYPGVVALRSGLEADRYGFVAHVLARRDGCSAESCAAFALLQDAATVKANIREQKFEATLARYGAGWLDQKPSPSAAMAESLAAPAPGLSTLSVAPVTRPIDFPSAASIPPVSIMTEPAAPAASPADARRPAAPAPAGARPQ